MQNKILWVVLWTTFFSYSQNKFVTFFEKGNGNQSANYEEVIAFYKKLDANFSSIKMQEKKQEDNGYPLHLVTYSADGKLDFQNPNKSVILIINAIHAGEPDGVDASMLLLRDLAIGKIKAPKNTIVAVIPVYNIGGFLNRNSTWRTNQNGPEEYGFRGNSKNYDLNRDLIKSDTKNTKALVAIYHELHPDIFIDNHVSNGADYQYTLTFIQTEPTKLGDSLGNFQSQKMTPAIEKDLQEQGIPSTPYVNVWNGTPDKGYAQFNDSPRYTTGYTALFHSIGYVVETHMWKPYDKRVWATYAFMKSTIAYANENVTAIKKVRKENGLRISPKADYPYAWVLDSSMVNKRRFLGYEGIVKKSAVTTGNRLFYDRKLPYDKEINFYPAYKPTKKVTIPKAYIIPKGWWNVIALLRENNCQYSILSKDTIVEVESYKIADYKTSNQAYEGHYLHRNTTVSKSLEKVHFSKGDYVFATSQLAGTYLLEVLEPEMVDSFFNWNFFDTILQQKEGYSDYLFEDLAFQLLQKDANLKTKFEEKLQQDKKFASQPESQLDWIHKNSVYYEKAHLQYPVYRMMQ